jgi:hypothetical protein
MNKENKMCVVMNRSNNTVVYRIPEDNVRRTFTAGESKTIPLDEIVKLTYIPGGANLIAKYLLIKDEKVVNSLFDKVEPEYNMTEPDIKKLMLEGSLDAFLDCLDFAPAGVIQIIKDLSVKLPLNDVAKRKAIKDKTNFDVDRAIANI